MPLRILICGGGIAGPTLAFWLAQNGHRVVVVERSSSLRASGAQIDLRGQAVEVIKRMGLLETVRSKLVDEPGVSFVDSADNVVGTMMANTSGTGAQTLTSEFEIMRADLVRILHDATKDNVEYVFGKSVEHYDQDGAQVVAHFSDGSSETYDVLVGADGQGSRIRKRILPADLDPYRPQGALAAYWMVPRIDTDENVCSIYHSPGGRFIMRRSHNPTETQVYFIIRGDPKELSSVPKASTEQQKEFWAQQFHDAGWQARRFLEGMKSTSNFFCHELVQVSIDEWHKGRVVLVGDAAHCPSPLSGMGTSSSLVGAYVLADAINQHPADLPQAFSDYEKSLRPFIKDAQRRSPGSFLRLAMPDSSWGVTILRTIIRVTCFLRIPDFLARFAGEDPGGWKLPESAEPLSAF